MIVQILSGALWAFGVWTAFELFESFIFRRRPFYNRFFRDGLVFTIFATTGRLAQAPMWVVVLAMLGLVFFLKFWDRREAQIASAILLQKKRPDDSKD